MKCGARFQPLTAAALFLGLVVVLLVLIDKCETYRPVNYIQASLPWWQSNEDNQAPPLGGRTRDKIIVVPAKEDTDVSWVIEDLSDWQHAIYIVDPSNETRADTLTAPVNKGHEAMAYLTYIIDNYNESIPEIVAFLHSHRSGFFTAWHVDTPLHDNVYAMRHLQLDYVKERGYVNLRCNNNPGCKQPRRPNPHFAGNVWTQVMGNTSTPALSQHPMSPAAQEVFSTTEDKERLETATPRLWTACCAQFAVSREQIYQRPIEDYINIRQWVVDTEMSDAKSGRVMEYLWHVIFGQEAVHCPDVDTCYCKVYGRCSN